MREETLSDWTLTVTTRPSGSIFSSSGRNTCRLKINVFFNGDSTIFCFPTDRNFVFF